jgi:glycosyltransferase involved in cell wall biosynthesis
MISELMSPAPGNGGKVLIIDHRLPSPDRDCGSLRIVEIIRVILARGHQVSFIPDNFLVWRPYFEDLVAMGVEVVHPPLYQSVADYLAEYGPSFDLAVISRAGIAAKHLETVRRLAPAARLVFDTVDLHFVREQRAAALSQDPELTAAATSQRELELGLARRADLTLVVSHVEKEILEQECPGIEVMVIPTIYPVEPAEPPGFDQRSDIVFIGGFAHAPNVDAVLYYAREIWPRVQTRLPAAVFKVIGPEPPAEVLALAGPRFQILGHVPDVGPVFNRALASVAPLRFGAGVKGKINHSMSLGVPVVVTEVAAEGMYLEHEENAMIADDPAGFADALIRVCESRELWQRLSQSGKQSLRDHFSVEAASRSVDELLHWAGLTRNEPRFHPRAHVPC